MKKRARKIFGDLPENKAVDSIFSALFNYGIDIFNKP